MVEFIDKPTPPVRPPKEALDIPGYKILDKLGEGTTAVVWRAEQTALDRHVAIKVLKRQLAADPQEVTDFINEAKAVAKLKSRSIIQVFDVGQQGDLFYFIMEYVEGQTLSHVLKSKGVLGQREALTIAAAVAGALEEAWRSGKIMHRDVKPDNIMLENDGGIKIADLGLAGMIDAGGGTSTHKSETAGTPNYMAPEQARGNPDVDFQADMYGLGATLYHMVTGQMPFTGEDSMMVLDAQQTRKIPNPRDLNPNVTPACTQLITKLMMKEPKYRYKNWPAAVAELDKLAAGKIVVPKVAASAESTVGKAGEVTPAEKGVARKPAVESKQAEARRKELKKKYGRQRAPLWLRLPLEVVLLAWLGFLVYQLLWLPVRPPKPPKPVPPQGSVLPSPPSLPAPPVTPEPEPNVQPEMPTFDTSPTPEQPTPPPDEEPVVEEPTPPAATGMSRAELNRKVAKALLTDDSDAARMVVQQAQLDGDDAEAKAEMAALLGKGDLVLDAVTQAFEQHQGQRGTLMYNGRPQRIEVKSVEAGIVTADLFIGTESANMKRSLVFKVSQLGPAEQSRWIGEATTPKKALAKFVLHMNAGDYVNARRSAETCGPLSEACIAEADARIQMLLR